MHHARLANSPRLRRALRALREAGGEISTMELSRRAHLCAVGTTISELRQNGAEIACRQEVRDGNRRWYYTLLKGPKT